MSVWKEEIQQKLNAATPKVESVPTAVEIVADAEFRNNAPAYVAKLLQALQVAENALSQISNQALPYSADEDVRRRYIALTAYEQLQSGAFGDRKS